MKTVCGVGNHWLKKKKSKNEYPVLATGRNFKNFVKYRQTFSCNTLVWDKKKSWCFVLFFRRFQYFLWGKKQSSPRVVLFGALKHKLWKMMIASEDMKNQKCKTNYQEHKLDSLWIWCFIRRKQHLNADSPPQAPKICPVSSLYSTPPSWVSCELVVLSLLSGVGVSSDFSKCSILIFYRFSFCRPRAHTL